MSKGRKPKKEQTLQDLIEARILAMLQKEECSRGDILTAIKFLEMKEKKGEGYGKGFQRPAPGEEEGDGTDLAYLPSPLESLPAEEDDDGPE
jgi:hypothetical protein